MKSKKTKVSANHKKKLKELKLKKKIHRTADTIVPAQETVEKQLDQFSKNQAECPPISCCYRIVKKKTTSYFICEPEDVVQGGNSTKLKPREVSLEYIHTKKNHKTLDQGCLCEYCQDGMCMLQHQT